MYGWARHTYHCGCGWTIIISCFLLVNKIKVNANIISMDSSPVSALPADSSASGTAVDNCDCPVLLESTGSAQDCLARFTNILDDPPEPLARITFGCSSLDELTDGGLPISQSITELYGEPGSGKTQICLQLIVSCVASGHQCVVINTEKRFPIGRLVQMIQSKGSNDAQDWLDHIWVSQVTEITAAEQLLEKDLEILLKHANVRLLVIDSVAGLFRFLSDDYRARAKRMRQFNRLLLRLQDRYKFTITCTNQAANSIDGQPMSSESQINPCLGPIWTEFLTTRLLVSRCSQTEPGSGLSVRSLEVIFSPLFPAASKKHFLVDSAGLRSLK